MSASTAIRAVWAASLLASALLRTALPAAAQAPAGAARVAFVPYAAAFSLEAKQPEIVDPFVFVIAPHAPAATGLLGIAHFPGIRNARMSDDPMQPALDANGKPLGFDLQQWFAASGVAELGGDVTGRDRLTVRFAGLVPNGRYSLFIARPDSRAVLPLDGSGRANSFSAGPDGTGELTLIAPAPPARGSEILLVFHSDRTDHGPQRGEIGIYAHVQLAAPIP